MNKRHMIDVESAGAGFAVSVAMAKAYNGQEISSVQALMDAGIIKRDARPAEEKAVVADGLMLGDLVSGVLAVYQEQYAGWMKRSLFERQWVLRDFKKVMRLSAEQVGERLRDCDALAKREEYGKIRENKELFELLEAYWEHQLKLLKGYEKDPDKLQENSGIILGWIRDIRTVIDLLN